MLGKLRFSLRSQIRGSCSVCGLRLGLNFLVRLVADKNFISGYWLRKCMHLRFLTINIYGHTGLAKSILRLRLIVQIQKLKNQSEILK